MQSVSYPRSGPNLGIAFDILCLPTHGLTFAQNSDHIVFSDRSQAYALFTIFSHNLGLAHMTVSKKDKRNPIKHSNDRKGSNLVPDLEDLGKMLKTCIPNQGGIPSQRQTPDGKDCQTCDLKDTCGAVVKTSSKLIEQGRSVSGKETQRAKDHKKISLTKQASQQKCIGKLLDVSQK